jgi:hypothetical protein
MKGGEYRASMILGSLAVRATIWLAVAAWVTGEWRRTAARADVNAGRAPWAVGALAALAHTLLAFHVHHGWSHDAALAATARDTAAVVGWRWGGGLYFNYVFVLLWLADAAWWWLDAASFARRPPYADAAVRFFLWFMFANGAFVFVRGPARWMGLAAAIAVAWAWYRGRGRGAVRHV